MDEINAREIPSICFVCVLSNLSTPPQQEEGTVFWHKFSENNFFLKIIEAIIVDFSKHELEGGFKSEETGGFLHCQNKYSKSLP